jgi:hypothetical protein
MLVQLTNHDNKPVGNPVYIKLKISVKIKATTANIRVKIINNYNIQ